MNLKSNASAAKLRALSYTAIFIICFLLNSLNANAQLSSAAVNGTVRDATGAVIEGANVSLREVSTGIERKTESNSTGNYAFVDVAPGSYSLEVAKSGFSTAKQSTLALHVNQTATFNFSLAVGSQVQYQGVDLAGIPHLAHPSVAKWFNTAAFEAPAQYTYGDVGRNTMRSDWYRDVDLSVFRRLTIKQTQTEFRAEAFNLTNTPVWGTPNATLNSTTFGKVSGTASTQRELQLALKISF